ncbi:Pycsar system effector family protein [Streptomyces antimycoticus]
MTITTPASDRAIDQALASVTVDLGKTDHKASLLLAFNGALAAGLAAAGLVHWPTPSKTVAAFAVAALVAATLALLSVVEPNTKRLEGASWPHWQTCTPEQIHASLATDRRTEQIATLSRIAARKYRWLKLAIVLNRATIVLLVAAGLLGAL